MAWQLNEAHHRGHDEDEVKLETATMADALKAKVSHPDEIAAKIKEQEDALNALKAEHQEVHRSPSSRAMRSSPSLSPPGSNAPHALFSRDRMQLGDSVREGRSVLRTPALQAVVAHGLSDMLAAGSVILLSGAVQKQSAMITEGLKGAVKGDNEPCCDDATRWK